MAGITLHKLSALLRSAVVGGSATPEKKAVVLLGLDSTLLGMYGEAFSALKTTHVRVVGSGSYTLQQLPGPSWLPM